MRPFFILILLIFSNWANIVAQSISDKNTPIIKLIKEVSYEVVENDLIDREELFNSGAKTQTRFNENGQITEYEIFDRKGKLRKKSFYERDEEGNLLEVRRENAKERVLSRDVYKYNSKNQLIKISYYFNDKKRGITSIKYNDKGNKEEVKHKSSIKLKNWRETYKYNPSKKVLQSLSYGANKKLFLKTKYDYDENGNETFKLIFAPNEGYTKVMSEYDNHNNLTKENWLDGKDERFFHQSMRYIYDENGNWITKYIKKNGLLKEVFERKIEYFNSDN